MGRVKVNQPNIQIYGHRPQALEREEVTRNQVRWDEATIIWGDDDALPLRIMDAVNRSPVAISCLGTIETFTKGSSFTDPGLMEMVIDGDGTTLWQLHERICQYFTLLDGFAVNFKYSVEAKITSSHLTGFESLRFCQPKVEQSRKINLLKFNPYFGTAEYQPERTKIYNVFDIKKVKDQMATEGTLYKGQIYYHGTVRPPYKFYPVPKYWSGDRWIYADSQLQTYLKELLDNGFFQSVLMNMIGNPNASSQTPEYQKEVTGADGVKRKESTKTVGQEFDDKMQKMFSGVKKAGTAMVLWALNKDQSGSIQEFPSTIDAGLLQGTVTEVIRGITIASEVPAILANLPQQVSSLGSDGNAMEKAVEIMQARVAGRQRMLEQFYNTVMLPNLAEATEARVKIVNYSPFSTPVEIEDKFWEFMNEDERIDFIKSNLPNVKIIRPPKPALTTGTPVPTTTDQPPPEQSAATGEVKAIDPNQEAIDAMIRKLSRKDLAVFYGYVNDYKKGRSTLEQTKVFLRAFKLTDEQIMLFLNDPEGDGV